MKKALWLLVILAIVTLVNPCRAMEPDTISREEAVKQIIGVLYASPEGVRFPLEQFYCVHAAGGYHFTADAATLQTGYPALCALYRSGDNPGFTDVPVSQEAYLPVALGAQMGLIQGSNGLFRPYDALTYGEAATMLVRLVGWEQSLQSQDGYPAVSMEAAVRLGILENSANAQSKVTPEAFDAILKKILPLITAKTVWVKAPKSGEACASAYAQAVKDRLGLAQYALLSCQMQEQMKQDFAAWNWVTGVSSPWVDHFEVTAAGECQYRIVYFWATSTGPAGKTEQVITVAEQDGVYVITALE